MEHDLWFQGVMPKIRAIILAQKQEYSKAEIRAGLYQGEEKAREKNVHSRARSGQISQGLKCTKMCRHWAFVRLGGGSFQWCKTLDGKQPCLFGPLPEHCYPFRRSLWPVLGETEGMYLHTCLTLPFLAQCHQQKIINGQLNLRAACGSIMTLGTQSVPLHLWERVFSSVEYGGSGGTPQ